MKTDSLLIKNFMLWHPKDTDFFLNISLFSMPRMRCCLCDFSKNIKKPIYSSKNGIRPILVPEKSCQNVEERNYSIIETNKSLSSRKSVTTFVTTETRAVLLYNDTVIQNKFILLSQNFYHNMYRLRLFASGKASLTPLTISEMWQEEERKSKELAKHFKDLALEKGVCVIQFHQGCKKNRPPPKMDGNSQNI